MSAAVSAGMVHIVDDDDAVRDSLSRLLRAAGMDVLCYATIGAFLAAPRPDRCACLLLDVRLQDASGLDFQDQLNRDGVTLPVVFMTGHGTIPMTVRAMKGGAVDFLAKPLHDADLLAALHHALDQDRAWRAQCAAGAQRRACYASLTPRERQVMGLAVRGLMNKQIAWEIGTSEVTVKIHRGKAMRKMQARTFADLVRMAAALDAAASS